MRACTLNLLTRTSHGFRYIAHGITTGRQYTMPYSEETATTDHPPILVPTKLQICHPLAEIIISTGTGSTHTHASTHSTHHAQFSQPDTSCIPERAQPHPHTDLPRRVYSCCAHQSPSACSAAGSARRAGPRPTTDPKGQHCSDTASSAIRTLTSTADPPTAARCSYCCCCCSCSPRPNLQ
jgi:hypothetical protein